MKKNLILIFLLFFLFGCSQTKIQESILNEFNKTDEQLFDIKYEYINRTERAFSNIKYLDITRDDFESEIYFIYNNLKPQTIESIYSVIRIESKVIDYGHFFNFDQSVYGWICEEDDESKAASYLVNFDEKGLVLNEEGTIMVDVLLKEDSLQTLFFTTAFHNVDSVIAINNLGQRELYFSKPFEWFPLMEHIILDFKLSDIYIVEIHATNKYSNEVHVYNDTVKVK